MKKEVTEAIKTILKYIGEDPQRQGLQDTPRRVIDSWDELFSGYRQDPETLMTTFSEKNLLEDNQIVILRNIDFFSYCEHHMLPFWGKAHIGYIPTDKIIGISKLARILDVYARRLQVQERIGNQVTSAIMKFLQAEGAACIIEAQHFCTMCRGIRKQNATMTTSSLKGVFMDDFKARQELLALIQRN